MEQLEMPDSSPAGEGACLPSGEVGAVRRPLAVDIEKGSFAGEEVGPARKTNDPGDVADDRFRAPW